MIYEAFQKQVIQHQQILSHSYLIVLEKNTFDGLKLRLLVCIRFVKNESIRVKLKGFPTYAVIIIIYGAKIAITNNSKFHDVESDIKKKKTDISKMVVFRYR